jgi:cytochrome c
VLGAGGWFAVNKLYRHNMLEKSRLQTEIPRLSQAERAIIADYVDTRIRSLKPELVTSYRVQLQESLTRVQQLLREHQAQEQQSAQATQQRIEGLRREVRLVENQLAAVDGSLVKLHGE